MDDRTLALLGDRSAQERITERGELLECPICGNNEVSIRSEKRLWWDYYVCCTNCGLYGPVRETEPKARKAWNTRAPILSKREMEMLDEGWSD